METNTDCDDDYDIGSYLSVAERPLRNPVRIPYSYQTDIVTSYRAQTLRRRLENLGIAATYRWELKGLLVVLPHKDDKTLFLLAYEKGLNAD